ncbi:Histidine phosphatase superfamily (branch 1) [Pseudomonas grimontii]|uniref:Histidine phosphatase superfamily (Branch 1) n=2 Tax=Pseudomonas grimontii TaxID=129847 RepID=A0ABY0TH67_9PSED|nr:MULTISPECIES: histidine phosphatase family protein [Pseudomonas]SDQ82855.1 Histidine phosphatase superfamily (branch 1) [Pseudomonas grimontii]
MAHAPYPVLVSTSKAPRTLRFNRTFLSRLVLCGLLLALSIVLAWLLTATHVTDLGAADTTTQSKLYAEWARGNVVLMIRHAERCDRSGNPCLGSPDGITLNGSQAAAAVGVGLQHLGLQKAHLIASPLTRTRQTADFISGQVVPTESWVEDCDINFKDAVLAHKKSQENLVLITHSGCIDHFERKMGVRAGQRDSAYTQAFFVQVDGKQAPRIIGSLDAEDWAKLPGLQSR